MAFSLAEEAQVRRWLGFNLAPYAGDGVTPSLSRITNRGVEAEAVIRDYLADLASVWASIQSLDSKLLALKVDEITIDAVRAAAALRQRGRMVVKQLAVSLELKARQDAFSAPKYDATGTPFDRPWR